MQPENEGYEGDAEWVARFAAELGVAGMPLSVQAQLLAIARDVAHGAERKYAPLASFIAGRHVEARSRDGVDDATALREVGDAVTRVLGDLR